MRRLSVTTIIGLISCAAVWAAAPLERNVGPTALDKMDAAEVALDVESLAEILKNSLNPELRRWSAMAIAQLQDASGAVHLMQQLGMTTRLREAEAGSSNLLTPTNIFK